MSALASLSLSIFGQHGQGDTTSAQAVLRGLCGRCPNCGRGHMFTGFLKVTDYCQACGEELFHQRADDFPAYLDILLVGHTVVPLALLVETEYAPAMWLQLAAWVPLTIGFSLGLLRPIKGAIIAMQWFGGMHGFGRSRAQRHGLATTRSNHTIAPVTPARLMSDLLRAGEISTTRSMSAGPPPR